MRRPQLGWRLSARWRSLPPRTIRLRLTAIYAGLFLLCGAGLLAINYALVSGRLTSDYFAKVSTRAGNEQVFIAHQVGLGGGVAIGAPVSGRTRGQLGGGNTVRRLLPASGPVGASSITKPVLPSRQVLLAAAAASASGALGTLLLESGIALAIMALVAAALGWVMAGRALRPLRAITDAAQEISASSLHRRLALAGPDDELRRLGRTFDALLERLEMSFAEQRQFAANVSHELRTPLTYERTLIEVALADSGASNERLRAVLDQVLASGEHQERAIEALLVLSRSQRELEVRDRIDLATLAASALAVLDAGELEVNRSLSPAFADGDPRLLERLVGNLVANAVAHNRPGGRVQVATAALRGRAVLSVSNTGPVIPPADLRRLFEPFQRLDGSRTSAADGLGLGLSIVKAIADTHGARIRTALPADGGLAIEVSFAAAEPPRPRAGEPRAAAAEPARRGS